MPGPSRTSVKSILLVGREEDRAGGPGVLASLSNALAALADEVTLVSIAGPAPKDPDRRGGSCVQEQADNGPVRRYVWSPPWRPVGSSETSGPWSISPMSDVWASWPCPALTEAAARADLIVIQPDPGAALIGRLRRCSSAAKIVCYASDVRDATTLSPRLMAALRRNAARLDRVLVAARAMLPCFDFLGSRVGFLPPGLEQTQAQTSRSPFGPGFNAVVIGQPPLDASVVQIAAATLSDTRFHILGPPTGNRYPANVVEHGALIDNETQSFIRHANLGLVPFLDGPYADHAVDLSRELALFDDAGVPSVCPSPGAVGKPLRSGYAPGRSASIRAALARTLFVRTGQASMRAPSWSDVAAHIVGLDRAEASTRRFALGAP